MKTCNEFKMYEWFAFTSRAQVNKDEEVLFHKINFCNGALQ